MATLSTNLKFAKTELKSICSEFDIDDRWATKRQASKYRMKRGRIYSAMRDKIAERNLKTVLEEIS